MNAKILLALALAFGLFWVCSPLVLPVAMGGLLALVCAPLQRFLERKKFGPVLSASLLSTGLTILILVPLGVVIFIGVKSGFQQLETLKSASAATNSQTGGHFLENLVYSSSVLRFFEWGVAVFRVDLQQLVVSLEDLARNAGIKAGEILGKGLSQLPGILMSGAIAIVSLFFFLVDGRRLVSFVRKLSLFSNAQTEQFLQSLETMCRSVILASVISGTSQAIVIFSACLIAGVPNAALLGMLVFLMSFVPVIGSAPVSLGLMIFQWVTQGTTLGIAFLIVAIIVGGIDNFVRPLFLKGAANLHPLLAFVSAFGGLQVLGFSGVFFGPIIAGIFLTTFQIVTERRGHS